MAYADATTEKDQYLPEDQESLLSEHEEGIKRETPRSSITTAIYAICCVSVLVNILGVLFYFRSLDSTCTTYTSQYASPISDAIPVKYVTTHTNGSFERETIYRQAAGPDVDAAWHELTGAPPPLVAVPVSQAQRYGLESWQAKLDPSTPGLEHATEPHLIAGVEVFHQLHCVDLLRKGSHWDYEYYRDRDIAVAAAGGRKGPFAGSEERGRIHFSHCLDMIRQRIMCMADTELIGQVWVEDEVTIMFSAQKKCRNYDDIRSWVVANQVQPNEDGKIEMTYFPGDRVFASKADVP